MSATGNFFAVDQRVWAQVAKLGVNESVSYLALARGTGRDNATTRWSVYAIERYTGISRDAARAAIRHLIFKGFIACEKPGSRPTYRLLPASEIRDADLWPGLRPEESCVLRAVQAGCPIPKRPANGVDETIAQNLHQRGILVPLATGPVDPRGSRWSIVPVDPLSSCIWLPNELVTGAGRELPPIELLRQSQDAALLWFFVELYGISDLAADGGIKRQAFYRWYKCHEIGERAEFRLFAYGDPELHVRRHHVTAPLWRSKAKRPEEDKTVRRMIERLQGLGLLVWVEHLFEGFGEQAELMYACPAANGTPEEIELARIVAQACEASVFPSRLGDAMGRFNDRDSVRLVLVPRHIEAPKLFGIARLRYRPKTTRTAAWLARVRSDLERLSPRLQELAATRIW